MHYLGIDLGDGESAVALLEENSVIEPVIQPIGGRGSIISAVGMSGTEVAIGERAFTDRKVVHLRSRFKSRFLTALDSEMDIERFAYGIKSELEKDSPGIFDDCYVAVGCPAGWKERDRKRYAELMRKAGLGNVHIVSESRAAFFYARYAHELNIAPELLNKTTLVIDIGSSTTDFAYIVNGKESSIGTFGDVSLGGGLIEACMLRRAVAKSPKREILEGVFKESASWKNRCEIIARRLKEQYFLSETEWNLTPCVASETVYYDEPVKIRFELTGDIMSEIISTPLDELHGATFSECLSDLMRHAETSTRENPPELIILTGGASRMSFFKEACAYRFPNATIVNCPEPEYSIAKGLAYAARIDKQLEDFTSDIEAYFKSNELRNEIGSSIGWLTVPLSSVLSGRIINDVIVNVLDQWKKGEIRTIDDMNEPILAGTDNLLRNLDDIHELAPVIEEWCSRLFRRVQPQIDAICRAHNIDRSGMTLSAVHTLNTTANVNLLLDNQLVNTVTYLLTTCIGATLCGGGSIALIAEGVVGLVIGALLGLAIAYFGKKAVLNAVSKANLNKFVRAVLYPSFKHSLFSDKQRKAIEDSLLDAMQKSTFASRLTDDVTISLETQVLAMAKSVEMPIVQ